MLVYVCVLLFENILKNRLQLCPLLPLPQHCERKGSLDTVCSEIENREREMTLNVADGRLSSDVFKAFDIPLTSCESSLIAFCILVKMDWKGERKFFEIDFRMF